jgi:hypothetical protein
MKRRPSIGKYALVVVLALGCETEDHAGLFAGNWYGMASYVYRQDGAVYSTDSQMVEQSVLVTGKNALLLQHFCGDTDPGISANVTSASEFSTTSHDCSVNPASGCPFTVHVESGSGKLDGASLALAFHGTLQQPATASCSALTLQFDITSSMTHNPPGGKVEVPQNLRVEKGDAFGRYALSWTVSDSTLEVEVQARIDGGDWNGVSFYQETNLVDLDVSSVPERTSVAFRVRTRAMGQTSDWSAEALTDTGFAAPELLDPDESAGVIQLRWRPRQDAVSMVIERSDSYEAPVWSNLAILTPPGSSYDDAQTVENHRYDYRFHWLDATTDSFRVTLAPSSLPLRAPVGLTAVASPSRVDLSWTNRSQLATEVVVLRQDGLTDFSEPGTEIAHLPASATTFSDRGLTAGLYTYSVEARVPGSMTSAGPVTRAATPPPASSGTWDVSLIDLPGDLQAALDADGGVLTYVGSLVASDSPSWPPYAPDGGAPAGYPYFTLDESLRPHLVYLRSTGQGPYASAVIHDSFDGTAWQSEEIARLDVLLYAYALDPTDHPAVLVMPPVAAATFRVVRWSGSAYVSESPGVSLPGTPTIGAMLITASPEGVIHVLAQDYTGVSAVHAWRATSWTSEPAPLGADARLVRAISSTGDILSLTTQNANTGKYQVLDHGSSGWGSPLDVGASGVIGDPLNLWMATAPDGSSPALALNGIGGLHIARRSDGWTPHLLIGTGVQVLGFGYDSSSHLYAIVRAGYVSSSVFHTAVFREH